MELWSCANPIALPGAKLFALFFPSSFPLCFLGLLSSVRGLSFLNDCQIFVQVVEVKKQGSLESSQALVGSNMVD